MTIRKIDHKQLKTRTANTGDILQVAAADDLVYVDPNNIVVSALTAGDNLAIEANGLITALAQAFTGNTDIVPEGANLYFTNTRTIDAVQAADDLILGNLIPKAGGVYDLGNSTVRWNRLYLEGNTLVLGNLFLKDVDGKLVVTDTEDGVTSNGMTTDVVLEGANLYFTNTRVAAYIDDNITTSNIVEGTRVYFTNARAIAAVLDNISTSNVTEGSNLYFTNARAIGSLTAGSGVSIEANGLIQSTGEAAVFTGTTDGITEGTSNLYYTNARVEAFIESNITTSNIAEGANLYFSNDRAIGAFTGGDNITIEANGLIIGQPGYTDEDAYANSQIWFANVATYSDENAYANSQIWFANITTSNVAEGSNLYFSNDRAIGALTGGDNITIEANGLIVGQPGYTDEDAYANSQVWFANVTTSNVAEGSNLYFTNTRAVEAFTAGAGIVIEANGLILSNAEATFNAVEVGDLTVTGNLTITGNATTIEANILQIDDPLIHLAANNETSDAVDIGFVGHYSPDSGTTRQHAGVFRKHNTDNFYIFSEYVDEGLDAGNLITNIDIANATFKLATVHANVFTGNVVGTVSDISNHDTDALVEGTSNLYFTNTRAIGALTAGDKMVLEANGLVISDAANVTVSSTPPANPNIGDTWIDSNTGAYLTYFGDGDSAQWAEVASSPVLTTDINLNSIGGNIIPSANETYNLGSADKRWKDLYLSGNTIYLGNTTISASADQVSIGNASIPFNSSFMFRNKIINGNFDIWQRGVGNLFSGNNYSADRWRGYQNGSGTGMSSQVFDLGQSDVPNAPTYFMRNVVTSVTGNSYYAAMQQRIESVRTLSGSNATVSFWAKADAAKDLAVNFEQYFGSTGGSARVYVPGQKVTLSTSWQKFTLTFSIPSLTGKTIGSDNNDYLSLVFWFDSGSNNDAATDSLGQQSGTFDIAQVQVEEGSAATPFEQRPYGMEFSLCERYYQNFGHFYPGHINTGNTTVLRFIIPFSVVMRNSPTVTFSNVTSGFSASNVGGSIQAKRLSIEVTASARTDFRPRIDAVADAEL